VEVYTVIGRMVQHVLPKGFKRIRYYGVQATKTFAKLKGLMQEALAKVKGLETSLTARASPYIPTPTVSLGATYAVACTYGCDDGRIAPTRCALIGGVLGDRWSPR
jgi:hypothetical protein